VDVNSSFITFEHFNKTGNITISQEESDNIVIDNLNTVFKDKWDITEFEDGTDKYMINNKTAPYIIGTFENCNLFSNCSQYAVMGIFIRLDNSYIIGQYMAQWNDFDKYLNQAEKIF
jgi:hypothetical protein